MDLTHVRTEDGRTTLITTRAALDEINAGMMAPTKRDVRQMSAVGSSANIEYRDGRKVDIRPATVEAVRAMADAAATRVTADPDATDPAWNRALDELTAALEYLAVADPLYAEALTQAQNQATAMATAPDAAPVPQWRTLKGCKSGDEVTRWEGNRKSGPTGEPTKIVVRMANGLWYATFPSGAEHFIGGSASKHWVA
jgi:hypothetical protein